MAQDYAKYRNNVRIFLLLLIGIGSLRELGQYGPMKPPDATGIDELQEKLTGKSIEKNEYYQADPMGLRTGNSPGPDIVKMFDQVIVDAERVLDPVSK